MIKTIYYSKQLKTIYYSLIIFKNLIYNYDYPQVPMEKILALSKSLTGSHDGAGCVVFHGISNTPTMYAGT